MAPSASPFVVMAVLLSCAAAELLPAIVWDPSNPMFSCNDPQINVRIGDMVNFVCPNRAINTKDRDYLASVSGLYETASLLNPSQQNAYSNCDARVSKQLLRCSNPSSLGFETVTFRRVSGSNNVPTFQAGNTYYVIGTSFRYLKQLDQKVGGSCEKRLSKDDNLLRLKIRVCTHDEIYVFKNCSVCHTADCYAKACMDCGPKVLFPGTQSTGHTLQIGNKCYTITEEQRCVHRTTDVAQNFEKISEIACSSLNGVGPKLPNSVGKTSINTARSTSTGKREDEGSSGTVIYIAAAACLGCFVGGVLLGLLVMKRRRCTQAANQTNQSKPAQRSSGTVSFSNGGFVTKDCSLEIQGASIGSPSKVYGNFDD